MFKSSAKPDPVPDLESLAPVSPPIGTHPDLILNVPTTLVIRDRLFSWSGDDFVIRDLNGTPMLRCIGKAFSLQKRKEITDAKGEMLFRIHTKLSSVLKKFVGEDAAGNEVFTVEKQWSFHPSLEGVFQDPVSGQHVVFHLRGGLLGHNAEIRRDTKEGPIVARVKRDFLPTDYIDLTQTFLVEIAAGVDLSLMAVMVISFDEMLNGTNHHSNGVGMAGIGGIGGGGAGII